MPSSRDGYLTGSVAERKVLETVFDGTSTSASVAVLTMREGDQLVSLRVQPGSKWPAAAIRVNATSARRLAAALNEAAMRLEQGETS